MDDDWQSVATRKVQKEKRPGVAKAYREEPINGGKKYFCDVCHVSSRSKVDIEAHIRGKRHKENVALQNGMQPTNNSTGLAPVNVLVTQPSFTPKPAPNPEVRPFNCEACNQQFYTADDLTRHNTTKPHEVIVYKKYSVDVEGVMLLPSADRARFFKCFVCDITTTARSNLEDHVRGNKHQAVLAQALKEFYCEPCERQYRNKPDFQNHIRTDFHRQNVLESANGATGAGGQSEDLQATAFPPLGGAATPQIYAARVRAAAAAAAPVRPRPANVPARPAPSSTGKSVEAQVMDDFLSDWNVPMPTWDVPNPNKNLVDDLSDTSSEAEQEAPSPKEPPAADRTPMIKMPGFTDGMAQNGVDAGGDEDFLSELLGGLATGPPPAKAEPPRPNPVLQQLNGFINHQAAHNGAAAGPLPAARKVYVPPGKRPPGFAGGSFAAPPPQQAPHVNGFAKEAGHVNGFAKPDIVASSVEESKPAAKEADLSKLDAATRKMLAEKITMCPLTQAVMTDPVCASDGYTYERSAIEKWMKHNRHSPVTKQPLPDKDLMPNLLVKQTLLGLRQK